MVGVWSPSGLPRVHRHRRGPLGVVQALLPVHAHRRLPHTQDAPTRALLVRRAEEIGRLGSV